MIKIEIQTTLSDEKWRELDSLYPSISNPRLFADPRFIRQSAEFWSTNNSEVLLVTGVIEDKIIGLLPLRKMRIRAHGLNFNALVIITYPLADVNPILCDDRYKEAFAEKLTLKLRLLKLPVIIYHLPEVDAQILHKYGHWIIDSKIENPFFKGNLNDLLIKKSLLRHENNFKLSGDVRYKHFEGAEAEKLLDKFFEMHIQRWQSVGVKSNFLDYNNVNLCRQFFKFKLNKENGIVLSVLIFNEEVIGMHLGFYDRQALLWHSPCYDVKYLNYWPGEVLLKAVINFAIEKNFPEFDLGNGNEWYKKRFSNFTRNYSDCFYFSKRLDQLLFFIANLFANMMIFHKLQMLVIKIKNKEQKSLLNYIMKKFYNKIIWYKYDSGINCDNSDLKELSYIDYVEFWKRSVEKPPYLPNKDTLLRFKRGWKLYMVENEPIGASFGWVVSVKEFFISEVKTKIKLPGNVKLIVNIWTSPGVRRRGLCLRLLKSLANRYCLDNSVYAYSEFDNVGSLKLQEKLAAKKVGYISHILGIIKVSGRLRREGIRRA